MLYKVDGETGVRLQGVKFKLVPSPNPNNIEHILVTDSNGRAGSPILANGTYEITEIETIFGYQLNAAPFSIVVGSSGVIRTIKNTKALTKINVHKEWFDGNNQDGIRLQQIEIKIFENYRSASDVREVKTLYQSVILNETNQWSFSLSDIPLYKTTGERVEYTAEEVRVPGYDSGLIADNQNGQINFNFKNSHTPKTVNLTWEKHWNDQDNLYGYRPANDAYTIIVNKTVEGITEEHGRYDQNTTSLTLPVFEAGKIFLGQLMQKMFYTTTSRLI